MASTRQGEVSRSRPIIFFDFWATDCIDSFLFCSTIIDDSDPIEEHSSVKLLQQGSEQGSAVTLEECFQVSCYSFMVLVLLKEVFCLELQNT